MSVSSDRMYLQLEDGTLLCLRAVDGVIQASTNGAAWADLQSQAAGVQTVTGDGVDNTDPANPVFGLVGAIATATPAAVIAALQMSAAPGPWTVVGPTVGDAQDLTLATGINGDTDGGYEIKGYPAALAGSETFSLRPNNVDTSCSSALITAAPGVAVGTGVASLRLGGGAAADTPTFRAWLDGARTIAGQAVTRMYRAVGAEQSDPASYHTAGQMIGTTNITSLVIHGSSADSIKAGSIFMWRKLNEIAS